MKKYKIEIMLLVLGIILTVIFRQAAVERRLSMGLSPSWGSEFTPLFFIAIVYYTLKADWSVN